MAQQTINIGASPNDGTGTPLRTAFQYTNSNFSELYTAVGPSGNNIVVPGNATITGALTVDTTTLVVNPAGYPDRVGIGTASPSKPLEVYNTTESTVWANTTTGIALLRAGGTGGDFYFGIDNSTGGGFGQGNYSRLIYSTGAYPIVFSSNASERYRIASDGVATWSNVGGVAGTAMTLNANGLGIGVTPSAWGVYKGLQVGYASLAGYAGSDTLLGSNVYFDGGAFRYIAAGLASSYRQLAGGHQWSTAVAGANPGDPLTLLPQMTLDASGNLSLANGNLVMGTSGKGIDFSATPSGSGTMTSELLSDYEEGTWTIGLTFGGGNTGITASANQGKYTKIGRQVTVTGYLGLTNKGSSTGAALLTGLPFLVQNSTENYSAASLHITSITFADFPMAYGSIGTANITLQEATNAGVRSNLTDADFSNNSEILLSFTYFV